MRRASENISRIIVPSYFSQSGPNLAALQTAMLNATKDCIKIISINGDLVTMNRAGCLALGVPEESNFGMPWLSLLPPDVHELGMDALQTAGAGQSARFGGRSDSDDGPRFWDNLLTPLVDENGHVVSILCVSRDVTLKTRLERDLEDALTRERLVCQEMAHRIKNLFSVVSGLIMIAEREAAEEGRDSATIILREKLMALARASDAALTSSDKHDGRILLKAMIKCVLSPYGSKCSAVGEDLLISAESTTNFALFLHELATNSLKYGSLGSQDGKVIVSWSVNDAVFNFTWLESGGPLIRASPAKQGFGTQMVDRILQASGGQITRTWRAAGLIADLRIPTSSL